MADDPLHPTRPRGESMPLLLPVLVLLAVLGVEEAIDSVFGADLDRFGIRPREVDGVDGIVLAPFLHQGFGHLLANTVPFLVMGAVVCLEGARRFFAVTAVIVVVAGVGTWLSGPSHSVHIGASGIVFGYLTYLMTRGVFSRRLGYLAGGLVVFLVYGSILWGLLPSPGVSWQGHFFGAVGGITAAWIFHGHHEDDGVV
jgi:membrane associated rhomboid family serine protease